MRPAAVRPTGVERTFDEGRLIVSKTDPKGVIRYANALFVEVSGYPEEAIVGQPHNLIRHPDMPRCVFALLWDRIAAGQEIFAYVLNLAADGAHYWVLAHVTPSFDRAGRIVGYHSNRRAPDRAVLPAITQLYERLRTEEHRHARPADALAAAGALFAELLAERDQSYDQFVWQLTTGAAR